MSGRRGERTYRLKAWKQLAAAARARAGYRCEAEVDGARCRRWAREVHHVVPLDEGGPAVPGLDGVRVLCDVHHMQAHGRTRRGSRWAPFRNLVTRLQGE